VTKAELIAFEEEVARRFEAKEIRGPIHLCGGNEDQLIEIFSVIPKDAWVLSTWRSSYHALLHGVPKEKVMAEILAGRSMMLHFPEHHFMSSAIVGGMLPIACGLAAGGERVYCFVGDMCASTGAFFDAVKYASCNSLPLNFIVEDNDLSTNTPTRKAWGPRHNFEGPRRYEYKRTGPHYQPLPDKGGF